MEPETARVLRWLILGSALFLSSSLVSCAIDDYLSTRTALTNGYSMCPAIGTQSWRWIKGDCK